MNERGLLGAAAAELLGVSLSFADIVSMAVSCYGLLVDTTTVTISPKFQVVIPRAVREDLHLIPGEKLRDLRYSNRVELIPVRPVQELRGFLKNMDTKVEREGDRL